MRRAITILTVSLLLCSAQAVSARLAQANRLPDQLSDQEFWSLVNDLSEPSGSYTGDNWISNESSIQDVIPHVKQLAKRAKFI